MRSIDNDYKFFCDEISSIEKFRLLTQLSYGLANEMLKETSDEKLVSIRKGLSPDVKGSSYCAADRQVENIDLICEWVTEEEYAKRYELSLENIRNMELQGKLGYTITKEDKLYIIWPREQQTNNIESLPKIGKKKFGVKIKQKTSVEVNVEEGQRELILALMGKKEITIDILQNKAVNMLNENCFLASWSAFELYIKNIIYTLFEMKPKAIFESKKIGKESMTYNEIFQLSNGFIDIENLKQYIVDTIISNQEKDGHSIHKLINFMKDYFIKDKDPYVTWYVYKGTRLETSYKLLMDIKEIRNSLIHDKGDTTPEFWSKIQLLEKPEDGILVISDDIYEQCGLILKAIAFNINQLVQEKPL